MALDWKGRKGTSEKRRGKLKVAEEVDEKAVVKVCQNVVQKWKQDMLLLGGSLGVTSKLVICHLKGFGVERLWLVGGILTP